MFEFIESVIAVMSGLNNLQKRLAFRGGNKQIDRMVKDKLDSLKDALLYSYQSATAVLTDGREFRCLINQNKIDMELDDKMISIPFEDICLNKDKVGTTTEGIEPTGVGVGSIIEWKETGTHWLIYTQYYQEIAYFRGLMRQCEDEFLEIDGVPYWYYLKRRQDKDLLWQKTDHFIFNKMNNNIEIYTSNTPETNQFFHRFKKIKLKGKPYEVEVVDRTSSDGILVVYLKEDFENKWQEDEHEEISGVEVTPTSYGLRREDVTPKIEGPTEVYPYDIVQYKILNAVNGTWHIGNSRARIIKQEGDTVTVEITTGKSGTVDLIYKTQNAEEIVQNISILSL